MKFERSGRVKFGFEQEAIQTMPRIMVSCDALILPSHVEGLGVVLLEGMAAGIPVLGSKITGIDEIIKDGKNGLFVQPRNPADIVQKIELLAVNRKLQTKLVEGGRKSVQGKFIQLAYLVYISFGMLNNKLRKLILSEVKIARNPADQKIVT